jgi:hypothetical protein
MKKLSLNEMEQIQGGGPYCRQIAIGMVGMLIGGIMGNPLMVIGGAIGVHASVNGCAGEDSFF